MAVVKKTDTSIYDEMRNINPSSLKIGDRVVIKPMSEIDKCAKYNSGDRNCRWPIIAGFFILEGMQAYAGTVQEIELVEARPSADGIYSSKASVYFKNVEFSFPLEAIAFRLI